MKRIEKDILFVLISSFVLVVAWVGFNIHHKWVTSTISEDLQLQIQPIAARFDTATIEKLKTRKKVLPDFAASADSSEEADVTAPLASPSPSSEPQVIPTNEPTPTPEEQFIVNEPTEEPPLIIDDQTGLEEPFDDPGGTL